MTEPTKIPWFRDPSIRLALATVVVPSIYRLCAMLGWEIPFSQEKATVFVVDGIVLVGGAIWIVRRIKRGEDPQDPAKKVTLT